MSEAGLKAARRKMEEAGVAPAAVDVFSDYYHQLESGETGLILEETIEPYLNPPMLSDVEISDQQAAEALAKTAIIKLNGGLGTSMGLDKAKTLLEVRDGLNFLDIIVTQVMAVRRQAGADVPLLFMNSFRTEADTLAYLERYPDLQVGDLPLSFVQNQEPKLRAEDLMPVQWDADPSLEWCPPGHGDLYTALDASGTLDSLIEAGYSYACVSNGDNLGAAPNGTIAAWFASTGAPYAAELCERTINDKKGGHLAIRERDGQLVLRDTAQTAPEEMEYFTDEFRHPFFHTNNLWFDLEALRRTLDERHSVLGLPLIRNEKTVDPSDPESTPVIQVESAMGAAIEVFEGATAICVGRDRFLPVKTTNELLLLRSDVYDLTEMGTLDATVKKAPGVDLTSTYYKTIAKFEERMPVAPSLREATSLEVDGDWFFEPGAVIQGDVYLGSDGGTVAAGVVD